MSVYLYSGTPGSYKSYHAVKECLTWLKQGKNLITNFPLNYQKRVKHPKGIYEQVTNDSLTIDYKITPQKLPQNGKVWRGAHRGRV